MDTALVHLAVRRGGYFTRSEAHDCGFDDRAIQAAVRASEWRRIRRGYSPSMLYDALDDADKHLVLCRIVQHRMGDRVAITHVSASTAWGHDQWGWDMSVVHVTRLDGGAGRIEAGIRHHRAKRREDEMRREGAEMSRWIWRSLERSRQPTTVRQIDSEIRESRRRYGHNRTIIA